MKGITNYLVIVITAANIGIGIIQEIRSKLAIDKLAILASSSAKVLRDGEVIEVPTSELVLDDVIILELGNQVPADCILADGNVEVNESLLTGESVSVKTANAALKKSARKRLSKSLLQRRKSTSAPIRSLSTLCKP